MSKNKAGVTNYFISDEECPKIGETKHKRSCQSFSFSLNTDYLYLKTSFMDESARLRN